MKKAHALEAFANSFGSYPIGYAISLLVLPSFAPMIQKDPFVINLEITLIYATISFARIFLLKELFDRFNLSDNMVHMAVLIARKISRRASNG